MINLPDPGVEFIVGDAGPVNRLLVRDGVRGQGVVLRVHALVVVGWRSVVISGRVSWWRGLRSQRMRDGGVSGDGRVRVV